MPVESVKSVVTKRLINSNVTSSEDVSMLAIDEHDGANAIDSVCHIFTSKLDSLPSSMRLRLVSLPLPLVAAEQLAMPRKFSFVFRALFLFGESEMFVRWWLIVVVDVQSICGLFLALQLTLLWEGDCATTSASSSMGSWSSDERMASASSSSCSPLAGRMLSAWGGAILLHFESGSRVTFFWCVLYNFKYDVGGGGGRKSRLMRENCFFFYVKKLDVVVIVSWMMISNSSVIEWFMREWHNTIWK